MKILLMLLSLHRDRPDCNFLLILFVVEVILVLSHGDL